MQTAIRVVFFDIDGTLYSQHANVVPQEAREAVAALRQRDIRVVIATGRHPIELDGAGLDGMVFDGFAAANGQMCLDGDRRLFAGFPIPQKGVQALSALFDSRTVPLWLFGDDWSLANMADEQLLSLAEMVSGDVPPMGSYDGRPLYQAVAFVDEEEEASLASQLPGCCLQRWGSEGVDIISDSGGKVEGMRVFLERFGCTCEQCMAFGDQKNDLTMLRYAGIGVAMGNGAAVVREAADFVTSSVDEGGVVRALEHFGLLEPGWRDEAHGSCDDI